MKRRMSRMKQAALWELLYNKLEVEIVLSVIGFFYILGICHLAGLRGSPLNLTVFSLIVILLPVICAITLRAISAGTPLGVALNTINHYVAIVGLLAFATIPIAMYSNATLARETFWGHTGYTVLIATIAVHFTATALIIALHLAGKIDPALLQNPYIYNRPLQITCFAFALFACMAATFQIQPSGKYPNYIIESILKPDRQGSLLASLPWAAAIVASAVALARRQSQPAVLVLALFSTVLTIFLYFDFSLRVDTFHYLTNVGPALHIDDGGKLMVDTFSQYGPGPVASTWVAFEVAGKSFGTANILVQIFNFAFYALIFVCTYRMTPSRCSAMVLAVPCVAIVLASWGYGDANINEVPSVLGFRHLPALCMVTALSFLPPHNRHSLLTALATVFASLWSAEALISAIGIHITFTTLADLRQRRWKWLAKNWSVCVAPALLGLTFSAITTRLIAGQWPDYLVYLAFFTHYSPLSSFWGIPSDGLFWGWGPMALALVVILSDAVFRVLFSNEQVLLMKDDILFHRFIPMGCLLIVTSAYFAGRAVDFTLAMGFLPFCAIAIPAFLSAITLRREMPTIMNIIVVLPAATAIWGVTVCLASFYRPDSPYASLIHECSYQAHCSPLPLLQEIKNSQSFKPWLELPRTRTQSATDNNAIVESGVRLIERWAADQKHPIVLLGESYDLGLSEAALMYTDKWHRWPRSFTFTDQMNALLFAKILATPVDLREGEIAIVRKKSNTLGPLEKGIFDQIRARMTLCELPGSTNDIAAYRLVSDEVCASTTSARELLR